MSRNFDFSQAANVGITVLPDLTVLPNPSDLLVVKAITAGAVDLGFVSAAAAAGAAATIADTPPAGAAVSSLWWDSTGTGLYIRYNDGNSTQWVSVENQAAIGTVKIADNPPTAADNSLWWDSGGTGLYVRYNDGNSTQWVAAQNPYTLTDSPHDSNVYARQSGNWVNLATAPGMPFLPITGGTISTPASLPSQIIVAPTAPSAANAPNGSQIVSHLTAQFSGGTVNDPIFSNILANTTVQGSGNTGIWGLNSSMTYNGTGGNGGLVASAGQAVRATNNAGGAASNPELWGALFNCIDKTNTDSAQTNYSSGVEIGMACGGTDSANNRRMLGLYLNKWQNTDATPVCHMGFQIAANVGSFDYPLQVVGGYNIACIDLRSAVKNSGAHTIWLADGGDIVWNTAGNATAYYDPTVFGSGGVHITAATQFDGAMHIKSGMIADGAITMSAGATMGGALNLSNNTLTWDTAVTATARWDAAIFAGAGGIHFNKNVEIDGQVLSTTINSGAANFSGAVGCATTFQAGGLATLQSGLSLSNNVAGSPTDLSHHIAMYAANYGFSVTGGFLNHVADTAATHAFYAGTVQVGAIGPNGVQTGTAAGPTWTTGSAAPAATAPVGSLYSRTGGAVGATLYVSRGGGTWAAVAGV